MRATEARRNLSPEGDVQFSFGIPGSLDVLPAQCGGVLDSDRCHARDIHSSGGPAESARDMMHSASLPQPGSEFDAFLFAPVGDDGNGMLLSVLSALARLDVDPWQEAANLARLPGSTAIERLTSLIAALPGRPASQPDPGTIAARLIAL